MKPIKSFYILVLLLSSFYCNSQIIIQGTVKDFKSGSPLAYVSVAVKGSKYGGITNEDGVFKISVLSEKDNLILSYIGYKVKIIPASLLMQNSTILLESTDIQLNEIVIHSDDEYLYNIFENCRKKIKKSGNHIAKVYFQLETDLQNQPVELLECYYNGYIKEYYIENLQLKNGRIALSKTDYNGMFLSLNSSKAICDLKLTENNDNLPSLPLQFNKLKLKKSYKLKRLFVNGDNNMYHIEFIPYDSSGSFFKGEIWIDKETSLIMKIKLVAENVNVHPFIPIVAGSASINNVSIYITQSYIKNNNLSLPEHVDFKYSFNYNAITDSAKRVENSLPVTDNINTSCIMYFYDYEKPFISHYKYPLNQNDYLEITSIPYIDYYWENNNSLIFTEKQKQTLDYFKKNGLLINFDKKINFNDNKFFFVDIEKQNMYPKLNYFGNSKTLWSENGRWIIKQDEHTRDSLIKRAIEHPVLPSNQYKLQDQLFLDVNNNGDSIQHYSAIIFDTYETFYNLPKEHYTDCFINIYFDICEIERRKMEKILCSNNYSAKQIDSIYKQTLKNMEIQTSLYLKQVQMGKNSRSLYKWNEYVVDNLNIDNIKIFDIKFNN